MREERSIKPIFIYLFGRTNNNEKEEKKRTKKGFIIHEKNKTHTHKLILNGDFFVFHCDTVPI